MLILSVDLTYRQYNKRFEYLIEAMAMSGGGQ